MDSDDSTFEVSLRVLGNELIGFRVLVNDFKIKWLVLGIVSIISLGFTIATFGPPIISMF